MKKRWYDYLWIASLAYLALGLFNILFAWLGLLCFFIPLSSPSCGEPRVTATATAAAGSCSACWAADLAFPAKGISRAG